MFHTKYNRNRMIMKIFKYYSGESKGPPYAFFLHFVLIYNRTSENVWNIKRGFPNKNQISTFTKKGYGLRKLNFVGKFQRLFYFFKRWIKSLDNVQNLEKYVGKKSRFLAFLKKLWASKVEIFWTQKKNSNKILFISHNG